MGGVDTVILLDPVRGSFAVPREWTDLAAPDCAEHADGSTGRLEVYALCELVALIDAVAARPRGGLAK